MCVPGLGIGSGVGVATRVAPTEAQLLKLPDEPRSLILCLDVSFSGQGTSTPPETLQVGCCENSDQLMHYREFGKTHLGCHDLRESCRVFERKVSYLIVVVFSFATIHIRVVKVLVFMVERCEWMGGITATRVKRWG
jgi:hypothetical protein